MIARGTDRYALRMMLVQPTEMHLDTSTASPQKRDESPLPDRSVGLPWASWGGWSGWNGALPAVPLPKVLATAPSRALRVAPHLESPHSTHTHRRPGSFRSDLAAAADASAAVGVGEAIEHRAVRR